MSFWKKPKKSKPATPPPDTGRVKPTRKTDRRSRLTGWRSCCPFPDVPDRDCG